MSRTNQTMPEQASATERDLDKERVEAEYALESPVKCPVCGERVSTLRAIRLLRTQVNFTSTLPRRGRVIVCSRCESMVPAELANF